MKKITNSGPTRLHFLFILALMQLVTSGCAFNMTRYTDGPLTHYLTQPIPTMKKPIARTLSMEKVMFMTSSSMKATIISDLVAREIYTLPSEVGHEVKQQLKLDKKFSKKATYAGLNTIAKNRAKARRKFGNKNIMATPAASRTSASTQQYIRRQESLAKTAYRKGDYLGGNIHNSAATNAITIQQSFGQAQASVDLMFSALNAVSAAGEAIIKSEFIKLRNWMESNSGAIGKRAPKGSHLSVFFLQFFDAKSFQLDSRNRVAVYMVLTDKNGVSRSVLEGSDILNCEDECNLFKPKPTAKVYEKTTQSADVQKQLWTPEGTKYLTSNGFDGLSGFYQYILLQHGLKKLSKTPR